VKTPATAVKLNISTDQVAGENTSIDGKKEQTKKTN
jgi:hypothetical protein